MKLRAAGADTPYRVEILPDQRENLGRLLRHARARVEEECLLDNGHVELRVRSAGEEDTG